MNKRPDGLQLRTFTLPELLRKVFTLSRTPFVIQRTILFACFIWLCACWLDAIASNGTSLEVEFWGPRSYLCSQDEEEGAYFVGGTYDIVITLLPEGRSPFQVEYTGISDWTWPKGLKINVSRSTTTEGPYQPTDVLRERLQLEYYVTADQAREDSFWRTSGQRPVLSAPSYHFAFTVPSEFAGRYLCVDVEWNHPQYGLLRARKPACKMIVAPCSEESQHMAWALRVTSATEQAKYQQAVALADSFINMGWHEIHGLLAAEQAARLLGRYDDAIRILDICFQRNNTVDIVPERTLPSIPTDDDLRNYERVRASLVELKNQQQR